MARILVRAGKDPFTSVAPETTLTQDVFNSNSGNFLFQHSVWKALDVAPHELVANSTLSERRAASSRDARRISEEFDHFVVPMANSFRADFADKLENLATLIEQLDVPVTVIGIGAQAPADRSFDALASVEDVTRRFVAAVLDRSASIGVRGEFTRDFLVHLGFAAEAIDVIGCPSLFLHGPDLQVHKKLDAIDADAALALNLTPEVPGIGAFATDQADRHRHLTYIGQDAHDLRLLLWGTQHPHVSDPLVPTHLHHRLYREDRMRLFVDTWSWYDFLAQQDFAYGTRFHGNVAALLAGTPAMMLAHDSRTLELAEYHRMPHRVQPRFDEPVSVEELYEATDLAPFNAAMPERFGRYTAFLERNGLEHRWQGRDGSQFDERLAAASFPPAVHTLAAPDLAEVAARLDWLRHAVVIDMTRHPKRYDYPFNTPTYQGAGSRHARLADQRDERLAAQQGRIDELSARLEHLERTSMRGLTGRVLGRLRRLFGRG